MGDREERGRREEENSRMMEMWRKKKNRKRV